MRAAALPIVLTGDRLPPRLMDLPDPPSALYLRGELPRGPAVAIVGTRNPTPEATRFARRLAGELARAGITILSGGAKGIDTAAHVGAFAAGQPTVVVAPAGYAAPYPLRNAELFQRIVARDGAYLSLVPDDEPARPAAFFPRNGCLVALAHAVIVVQAGVRSGARNAAAQARRLGRPLLVVPWSPSVSRGGGCLVELRLGALVCERARDVLSVLDKAGVRPVSLSSKRRRRGNSGAPRRPHSEESVNHFEPLPLPSELDRVVLALRGGALYPDQLVAEAGLSPAQVQEVLLTLKLRGVLVANPSGRLELANSANL